jgi:replicative DNA helicase
MSDDALDFVDLDLERQILKHIALEDSSVSLYLNEDLFFGRDEQIIFEILKKLQATFPKKTLKNVILKEVGTDDFDSVADVIDDMMHTESVKGHRACEALTKHLKDLYLQRTIIESSYNAIELAKEDNVEDALKELKDTIYTNSFQSVESGDYIEDYQERESIIKAQKSNEREELIKTGLIHFDKQSGGIKKGEVGVILGKTGGGKSLAKLNFAAIAWMLGHNVIHIGLEMSKHENQFRMDSLLTNIPATFFRLANMTNTQIKTWKSTIAKHKKERKNYIEFISGKSSSGSPLTINPLLALVEGIEARRGKLDLLILDHILLVPGEQKKRDFHMVQWDNFQVLSDWATTRNKAVWTSSQVTDEGIKRKGGMRTIDTKYGRAISELAQIQIALFQSDMDIVSNQLRAKVIKGRAIKAGSEFVLKPDFDRMLLDTLSWTTMSMTMFGKGKGKGKSKKAKSKRSHGTLGE